MIILIKSDEGETLGRLLADENAFSSGSRGFYGQGKIEIGGKKYRAQVQLVEIGSKEQGKGEAA